MILTVTLNPAWDVTYVVDRLTTGTTHRVSSVLARAGGKGVNVSSVLRLMGQCSTATGIVCGTTGLALRADLARRHVPESFVEDEGANTTRSTVTVVESGTGRTTVFNEPGPTSFALSWRAVLERLCRLIAGSQVVVVSGSTPPGLPVTACADLVRAAHDAGVPVVLDCDGEPLRAALAAGPDLVKPNRAELAAATATDDLAAGARVLLAGGARAVVVSDGAAGLTAVTGTGTHRAVPPQLTAVNPTGAGDAAVAALAVGLHQQRPLADVIRTAAAWSAASVLERTAGCLDPELATAFVGPHVDESRGMTC